MVQARLSRRATRVFRGGEDGGGGGGEVDVFSEGANFWSKKNEKTSIALGCISRVFMMKKEIKRRSKSPSLDLIKYNLKLQNVVGTTWNI